MSDIFLSYSNEDRQRILPLAHALEGSGWSVFWDRTIPAGKTWRHVIGAEIKNCHCVIVVWTSQSVESAWVQEEAEEGKRRDVLLPVMLDKVAPPFGFGNIQAADLTGWNGSTDAPAFQRLVKDASEISGMPSRVRAAERESAQTSLKVGLRDEEWQPPESARNEKTRDAPEPSPTPPAGPGARRTWTGAKIGAALGIGAIGAVAAFLLIPNEKTSKPAPTPVPTPAPTVAQKPAPKPEISVVSVAAPPPGYFVLDSIARKPDASLRLTQVSERRNKVTDDEEWWIGNRLDPLSYQVPNLFMNVEGNLPSVIPEKFRGLRIVAAIRSDPILAIYGEDFSDGRYLCAVDPSNGGIVFAMDFSAFQWPHQFSQSERQYVRMKTEWAYLEAGILYVSHAHRTYARSSNGYNAYISAVDVRTGALLWRSQPLVSNAQNFVVRGDAIVSGYGFTSEPDFVYVLNRADGRVVQQVPVKSGPSYLVDKEDRLYVRTYNTDYVFQYGTR